MSATKFVFFEPIRKPRCGDKCGTLYSGAQYVALWASCLLIPPHFAPRVTDFCMTKCLVLCTCSGIIFQTLYSYISCIYWHKAEETKMLTDRWTSENCFAMSAIWQKLSGCWQSYALLWIPYAYGDMLMHILRPGYLCVHHYFQCGFTLLHALLVALYYLLHFTCSIWKTCKRIIFQSS